MTEMKIAFFGDPGCPYCLMVMKALEKKGQEYEMNDVSRMLDHPSRAKIVYEGALFPELKGKTFGELFEDQSVPKMILQEGDGPVQKITRSDEMVDRIEDEE